MRRLLIAGGLLVTLGVPLAWWALRPVKIPAVIDPGVGLYHQSVSWQRPGAASRISAEIWARTDARRAPTYLFSPGLGQVPGGYKMLLGQLALEGFVVVAVAHDTAVVNDTSFTRITEHTGRELSIALDSMAATHDPRMDLEHVAAFGHSLGGAASADACYHDARFKACADLDGTIFGDAMQRGIQQPFVLIMAKLGALDPLDPPRWLIDHDQARLHEDTLFAHSPQMTWVTVRGLRHMNFADENGKLDRMPMYLTQARTREIALWYIRRLLSDSLRNNAPFSEVTTRYSGAGH